MYVLNGNAIESYCCFTEGADEVLYQIFSAQIGSKYCTVCIFHVFSDFR